jgi:conjugal transfer pilus assembly protein TraW
MMDYRLLALSMLFFCATVPAKDLGTWGDLYPIHEPDLLNTLHQRLNEMQESGELAQKQQEYKEDMIRNSLRPLPVPGLAIAQKNRTWMVDPTFIVARDISDPQGRVFAHRGQRVNPLDVVPFAQTLYFIDADDKRQLSWMKAQKPKTEIYKIILVKGNIRDATEALNTRIYFDQQGQVTDRFSLKAVPARVTAAPDGKRLQVDEIAMEGRP